MWAKRIGTVPNAYLLYHSFDHDCDGCIFAKGTVFASGRNLLLKQAWKNGVPTKYYVFVDEDIVLSCKSKNCWTSWNEMLLRNATVSRFIAPKTWHDPIEETNFQTCIDDAMWAIRADALNVVFPLVMPYKEGGSWWEHLLVLWEIFNRCEPHAFLSDNRWRADNPIHRPYPSGNNEESIQRTLDRDYADLRPWTRTRAPTRHRCSIKKKREADTELSPACSESLRLRFDNWIGL